MTPFGNAKKIKVTGVEDFETMPTFGILMA